MNTQQAKWMRRKRRHQRIRNRVKGTSSCPRLSVYRSLRHIYGQLIDDERGATLVSVCTLDSDLRDQVPGGNRDSARTTGKLLAEKAREKGIVKAVFDRGGCKFHGRVAALAEGARAAGLKV